MLRPRDLCQDSGTKTFLDAMQNGQVHLARFVLDAMDGRIINSKTENNKTPLMYAVTLPEAGSRLKFARLLLEKGADVNCQDEHGRTALSLACEMGHLDVVKLLVQFSANPEITDAWGNSALAYASCEGHTHILDFLVRAFKRLGITTGQVSSGSRPSLPWQVSSGQLNQEQRQERRPNRLPKQLLERFTQQLQNKCEDHLPAVFQRHLKMGERQGTPDHSPHRRAVPLSPLVRTKTEPANGSPRSPRWESMDRNASRRSQALSPASYRKARFSVSTSAQSPPLLPASAFRRSCHTPPPRQACIATTLSSHFLRRFTSPEFPRFSKEMEGSRARRCSSETFPLTCARQANVDNGGSLHCEFRPGSPSL